MLKDLLRTTSVLLFGLILTSSLGCASGGGGGGGGGGGAGAGDGGAGGGGGDDGSGGGDDGGDGGDAMDNENENMNDGDGGGSTGSLEVVDSGFNAHVQSLVAVSAPYIAYRSNASGTFQVKVLDTSDNTEQTLVNDSVQLNDFAVAGSWVIARGLDLGIYAFDASNGAGGTNRLGDTQLGGTASGNIHSDGGSIVAYGRTDGALGWVDVSGAAPTVNAFDRPADFFYERWYAWGTQIAVYDDPNILILDTTDPTAAPISWPASVDTTTAISYNGSHVIYADNDTGELSTLNVADGSVSSTGEGSRGNVDIGGDNVICGYSDADSFGATQVGVYGTAGGSVTLAPDEDLGSRASPGWGLVCAVSDDGRYVFSSGFEDPTNSQSDLLSVWDNGANPTDEFAGNYVPNLDDTVSAGNVSASGGLVGFLLATDDPADAHIGYIDLP